MDPGKMNNHITLERSTPQEQPGGGIKKEFVHYLDIWAHIKPSRRKSDRPDNHYDTVIGEKIFTIYYDQEIYEHFQEFRIDYESRKYYIVDVLKKNEEDFYLVITGKHDAVIPD